MQKIKITLIVVLLFFSFSSSAETRNVRFHLLSEPHSLDPAYIRGTIGGYLFSNIYRGLYTYHSEKGLVPVGAKSCEFINPKKITCVLNPLHLWSDGKEIEAQEYVEAFKRILDPKSKSLQWESIQNLKNALAIKTGKKKMEVLGMKAISPSILQFHLEKPDPEFLYRLIGPAFAPFRSNKNYSPYKSNNLITSGPYKIAKWKPGSKVILKPNHNYVHKNKHRPPLEIRFIADDTTALNLYDLGKLNYLRRVGVADIPAMQGKKDFKQLPMARMDYMGFAGLFKDQKDLRIALTHSLKYEELGKIYHALGTPGCPSLLQKYYGKPICYKFDLEKSKKHFAKVPKDIREKRWTLHYSKIGGESLKKGMEWIQSQWKKHLGFNVDLSPNEQGLYISMLQTKPPEIFRKGVGMDRPSCLAGLEVFTPGHPENYINYNDKRYVTLLEKMAGRKNQKALCRKAIQNIMDSYMMVPMGEIHFSFRMSPELVGWDLNELNFLDFANLKFKSVKK